MYKHVQEKKEKVPTTSEMLEDYKKNQDTASKKRKHYDDTACNIYLKLMMNMFFKITRLRTRLNKNKNKI